MTAIQPGICVMTESATQALTDAAVSEMCVANGTADATLADTHAIPETLSYETVPNYLGAGRVFRAVSTAQTDVCLPEISLDQEYALEENLSLLPRHVQPYLTPLLTEAGSDLIRFRLVEAVTPEGETFPRLEVYRVGPDGDPVNPSLRQSSTGGNSPRVAGPSIPLYDMGGYLALFLVIDKTMMEMNVPEKLRLPATMTTMYVANLAIYNTGLTLSEHLGVDVTLMSKMNPNFMMGSIPLTMSFTTLSSYLLDLVGDAAGVEGLQAGHLPNTITSGTLGLMPLVLSQVKNGAGAYIFPRLAAAVNSSLGLTGTGTTWMGRNIFLAKGGPAGGGGALGASFQVLNAAFAVIAGLYIGDAVVDAFIDDGSPEAAFMLMAKARMYHEAHGWAGGFLGPLASGLLCLVGKEEYVEEGLDIAKTLIRDEVDNWGWQMQKFLLQVALHSTQGNEGIDWMAFESNLRSLFAENRENIGRGFDMTRLLSQNYGWDAAQAEAFTNLVDRDGNIIALGSLKENIGAQAEMQFRTKSNELNRQAIRLGLAYYDGDQLVFQPPNKLTLDQKEFLEGDGLRLSMEIAQLAELMRLLEPQVGDFQYDRRNQDRQIQDLPYRPEETTETKYA